MRFEEFKGLPPRKQHQMVMDEGVLLGMRRSQHFSIYLYALYSFYVELFFFKQTGEYVTLNPFKELEQLDPYLTEIDLGQLTES